MFYFSLSLFINLFYNAIIIIQIDILYYYIVIVKTSAIP